MFDKKLLLFVIMVLFLPLITFADENDREYRDKNIDEDSLLFFDDTPRFDNLSLDIDGLERLEPKANSFELLSYAPMSNKIGERWALVTVKNTTSGRRFLKSDYIVATFANEEQSYAIELNESVDAGQIISKIIFFGVNKFPIILIEVQH